MRYGGFRRVSLALSSVALITIGLSAFASPAAAADCAGPRVAPVLYEGNPPTLGYRIDSPRGSGSFQVTIGGVVSEIHYEIYDDNTHLRFWETSGAPIVSQVVVKASDAFVYTYNPAVADDCNLRAPDNRGGQIPAISHIDFGFVPALPGRIEVRKHVLGSEDRSGFEFSLERNSAGTWLPVAPVRITDATGVVVWDGLQPGEYRVTETARAGWMFATPSDGIAVVALVAGQGLTIDFSDTKLGMICVEKSVVGSEDVSGFEFTLGYVNGETWELVPPVKTTDATGIVCWDNLKPGQYKITETARSGWMSTAPVGGLAEVSLAAGQRLVVPFTNTELGELGAITVRKFDAGTTGLTGATFELRRGTELLDRQVLTNAASYTWTGLAAGTYTVTEANPPPGYLLANPPSQAVTLTAGNMVATVDFHNAPRETESGSITVRKFDAGTTGLTGATFELRRGSELLDRQVLTNAATYTWTGLAAGTYTVTETNPPPGYLPADPLSQTVTLSTGNMVATVDFHNAPRETDSGSITVRKFDAGTTGLTGATFELRRGTELLDRQLLTNAATYTWTGLAAGTYTVTEANPPPGYLPADPLSQTVTLSTGNMVATVDFHNAPSEFDSGSITVRKFDAGTTGLTGATFQLWRGGALLSTQSLAGSTYTWNGLAAGIYTVTETVPPAGYRLTSPSSQAVTLSTGNMIATVDFHNAPRETEYGSITVRKRTGAGAPLSGARFALYRGEVSIGELSLSGPSYTWTNLAAGTYTLVEVAAPAGWVRAVPSSKTVTLSQGEDATVTFDNAPIAKGSITVVKLNTANQPLNGATFALFLGSSKLDERILTGNTHTWPNLDAGVYTVVEVAAPPGHVKANPDRVTVNLAAGQTAVASETVTFRNPLAPGSITVVKLVRDEADGTIGPLNGATFALYRPDPSGAKLDQRTLSGNEYTWADLAPGEYAVVEVAVPNRPDGIPFELADPVSVTVVAGQNVRVEIYNELPRTGVNHLTYPLAGLLLLAFGLVLRWVRPA